MERERVRLCPGGLFFFFFNPCYHSLSLDVAFFWRTMPCWPTCRPSRGPISSLPRSSTRRPKSCSFFIYRVLPSTLPNFPCFRILAPVYLIILTELTSERLWTNHHLRNVDSLILELFLDTTIATESKLGSRRTHLGKNKSFFDRHGNARGLMTLILVSPSPVSRASEDTHHLTEAKIFPMRHFPVGGHPRQPPLSGSPGRRHRERER